MGPEQERILKALIAQYGGAVKTICAGILAGASREDVEEAVADCYVAFWKLLCRKEGDGGAWQALLNQGEGGLANASLRRYLYAVARNTALSRLRKTKADRTHRSDFSPEELELCVELDMTEEVARRKNEKLVNEVLAGLAPPEREIFFRRYYLCQRIKQIAAQMELTEKTVENKLYRTKARLRDALLKGGIVL